VKMNECQTTPGKNSNHGRPLSARVCFPQATGHGRNPSNIIPLIALPID
jgi:hypothetical protein